MVINIASNALKKILIRIFLWLPLLIATESPGELVVAEQLQRWVKCQTLAGGGE